MVPFKDRKSLGSNSNAAALTIIKDSLIYELASIPVTYRKILVGHLAIEGSIPIGDEIDDINNELFCPLGMFKGYDNVWMGHVHKPQVMSRSPFISHIGSMDISNFGETDQKKHIVIFDCDSGEFSNLDIPTRPLKKISISVPKTEKNTTEYIIKELKKLNDVFDRAIVRVEVNLESFDLKSINKFDIEKFLVSKGAFSIAGISESKKISVIKKDINNILDTKMDMTLAIKTYATTYIDEKMRSDFMILAIDIYNTYKSEVKDWSH